MSLKNRVVNFFEKNKHLGRKFVIKHVLDEGESKTTVGQSNILGEIWSGTCTRKTGVPKISNNSNGAFAFAYENGNKQKREGSLRFTKDWILSPNFD